MYTLLLWTLSALYINLSESRLSQSSQQDIAKRLALAQKTQIDFARHDYDDAYYNDYYNGHIDQYYDEYYDDDGYYDDQYYAQYDAYEQEEGGTDGLPYGPTHDQYRAMGVWGSSQAKFDYVMFTMEYYAADYTTGSGTLMYDKLRQWWDEKIGDSQSPLQVRDNFWTHVVFPTYLKLINLWGDIVAKAINELKVLMANKAGMKVKWKYSFHANNGARRFASPMGTLGHMVTQGLLSDATAGIVGMLKNAMCLIEAQIDRQIDKWVKSGKNPFKQNLKNLAKKYLFPRVVKLGKKIIIAVLDHLVQSLEKGRMSYISPDRLVVELTKRVAMSATTPIRRIYNLVIEGAKLVECGV